MPEGRRQLMARLPGPGADVVHLVPPFGAGMRLDAYLARLVGEHSRAEWQRLIESGIVLRNSQPPRAADRIQAGDRITVRPVARFALAEADPQIALDVVYEDPAMLAINKPAGLVVRSAGLTWRLPLALARFACSPSTISSPRASSLLA